jgi:hypothetical protein
LSSPETTESADVPAYDDVGTAPYIAFDRVAAHGVFNGTVQIELASRILIPLADGRVEVKFATCGRLRCSVAAATQLRAAADAVLKMYQELEQTPQAPAAASKLN